MTNPSFGQVTDYPAFLSVFNNAVVNASGIATVTLTPHGENWRIQRLSVKVSTKVLEAVATVYRGLVGDLYVIEASFSGSSGDTTDTEIVLRDGENVIVQWTGADIGATATVTATGWRSNPLGGFRAAGA